MSSDWDLEIQQNDSPLNNNYERLCQLNIKTKQDVNKSLQLLQVESIEKEKPLEQEIGSALRLKQRIIKNVQKESSFRDNRMVQKSKEQLQLNNSKDSTEKKGILKNRDSFASSSSSERISQKHVKFSTDSSLQLIHMILK